MTIRAVGVGQTARLNVSFTVTGETTRVEVNANVVDIDTERITVGGVVNTKQIDELPLNGRNYLELAKLEPGVEIADGKAFDPTKTRYTGVSIGGRSGCPLVSVGMYSEGSIFLRRPSRNQSMLKFFEKLTRKIRLRTNDKANAAYARMLRVT